MAEKRPLRVVVLGGGFAGGYVAKHLFDKNLGLDVEVIIIDRNNYFVFYPLLVEAGTGSLDPGTARFRYVSSPAEANCSWVK